jgi:hypothetical protein
MTRTPRLVRLSTTMIALAAGTFAAASAAGPHFYSDDPLMREPETQDARAAQPSDVGLMYDLGYQLFVTAGSKPKPVPAGNVNTIDEVPDSSWFTNRILPGPLSPASLARGPNAGEPPDPERWVVVRPKTAGYSPGFTARDANGETWFLTFDAPDNPEGGSAAIAIANKIFWALGYNQIDTYITRVDPAHLTIDPDATMRRPNGKKTRMTRDDLNAVLERSARSADGTYRAAAGRMLSGKVLGPFRYDGTRPDDPNDIVPHEDRRELRALRVFGAWTNLTDLKAGNTLDALVESDGRSIVRHYLQDVGSTFGIGANGPHDWNEGFEYFYEGDTTLRRLASFGFALRPWQTADYTIYPAVGRFESDAFDPETWRPHAPTPAYMRMQPDDAFWAARRLAAFDDDAIRTVVHEGKFSDAAAEQHLAAVLIARRDKILRAYLPAVNPLVNARLSDEGRLTFDNAAVMANVASPPVRYRVRWFQFDNDSGARKPLGETYDAPEALAGPPRIPSASGTIIEADVTADDRSPEAWQRPVRFYFRRGVGGWTLVGLEREEQGGPQTSATHEQR